MSLQATASQTVGPYFSIGLDWLNTDNLVREGVQGEKITIEGRVLDGDGKPVRDALIEVWQANTYGKYPCPEDIQDKTLEQNFRGFGRIPTSDDGEFRFHTIKPGAVPGADGQPQAPHIMVTVFMRGILRHLTTRIYFADEVAANDADQVLKLVPAERRTTLLAQQAADRPNVYQWNVVVQGAGETVFFSI